MGILRIFKDSAIKNSRVVSRNIIILIVIFIAAFFAVTLTTFLFIRKGPPEVAVPKVTNKDLIEGLLILQKKNLRVIIDPRYFSDQP